MVPHVLGFEFDEQARSRLQLGVPKIYECPTNSSLECIPSVILHQAKKFQLQRCCGIQLSVSHKPMKLEQTNVIQTITERHLMLIVSLSDFQQFEVVFAGGCAEARIADGGISTPVGETSVELLSTWSLTARVCFGSPRARVW